MVATFPNYLRDILRKGLTEKPSMLWRDNPTEMGPPIRVKLYGTGPTIFSANWLFDEIEFQAFDGWFKTQIGQGSDSFTLPILTGVGIVDHECKFIKGNPKYTQDGRRTRVKATIQARFKRFDTDENIADLDETLQGLFDGGDPRPTETIVEFQQFMQVTLPDIWAPFL